MCLHAVSAEYFQLVCDNFAHRNGRSTLLSQHQPDLDVLVALAQMADGIETGDEMCEGIQENVSAPFVISMTASAAFATPDGSDERTCLNVADARYGSGEMNRIGLGSYHDLAAAVP